MYKVGDLVRILPRIGSSFQYRFCYADEMLPFEGQILKIKYISDARYAKGTHVREDDCKCYHLEGNDYNWASSMFELYSSETKGKSIEEGTPLSYSTQQESYKLNFNI